MDRTQFKHHIQLKVRSYEIDWQGIVHNAVYLQYFELGRVGYIEELGITLDINSIQREHRVVLARAEVDYRAPARLGDVLAVLTRVSYIRNTSFAFEGILEVQATQKRIAENRAIHVWLDHRSDQPVRVPDSFRKQVQRFEGDTAIIDWPAYET